MPIDGVSMVYSFADADAPTARKSTQYFENMPVGDLHEGWYAVHSVR